MPRGTGHPRGSGAVDPAAAVAALGRAVDELAGAQWWRSGEDGLVAAVLALEVQRRRLDAATLRLTSEVESRGVAAARATTDTGSWLAHRLRLRPGEAAARVRTAEALAGSMTATREALEAGRIHLDHAHVITTALGRLHADVTEAVRGDAEAFLVGQARVMDARQLAKVARALGARLDPGAPDECRQQEASQHRRRRFSAVEESDGGWWLSGYLDGEGGRALSAALDPLSAPHPCAADGPDTRSPAQRRADALVDLAERALALPAPQPGALPAQGGARPSVVTTVDVDVLLGRVSGCGFTDADTPVSAATVRRLACDARLVPAVLGGDSSVLDLGRAVYAVPPALRRAVSCATAGAPCPAAGARPPGATAITSTTGPTADRPAWRTSCWSAVTTTAASTTAPSTSRWSTDGPPSPCPAATRSWTRPSSRGGSGSDASTPPEDRPTASSRGVLPAQRGRGQPGRLPLRSSATS